MTTAELIRENGLAIVAVLAAGLAAFEPVIRRLWNRVPVVRQSEKAEAEKKDAAAAVEVLRLEHEAELAKRDHAWKVALDRNEARELHLTGANEELIRQAASLISQLAAAQGSRETALADMRGELGTAAEIAAERTARIEALEHQLAALQLAHDRYRITRDDEAYVLRNALQQKDHRGYLQAKRREKEAEKDGLEVPFTATDVWPEGKPKEE